MRINLLNENFINAVREKIPQKTMIANRLAEILKIEKEAVYRRLRGDVPFSFADVAIISFQLGLSLDNLIGSIAENSKPFHLKLVNFIHPTKEDLDILEFMTNVSDSLETFTGTEYGAAMNMIPLTLSVNYDNIFRFYVYKWLYQNTTQEGLLKLKDVIPHPEAIKRIKDYPRISGLAEKINYIWSEAIFQNVVTDVNYFNAINLISNEEKAVIKQELYELINELEALAIKGVNRFGNKIYIYISNICLETSYSYVITPNFYLTMIMTFTLNQVVSIDPVTSERTKQLMQSLKRTSTLISESGEMYRIQFFEKQRAIINTL